MKVHRLIGPEIMRQNRLAPRRVALKLLISLQTHDNKTVTRRICDLRTDVFDE